MKIVSDYIHIRLKLELFFRKFNLEQTDEPQDDDLKIDLEEIEKLKEKKRLESESAVG